MLRTKNSSLMRNIVTKKRSLVNLKERVHERAVFLYWMIGLQIAIIVRWGSITQKSWWGKISLSNDNKLLFTRTYSGTCLVTKRLRKKKMSVWSMISVILAHWKIPQRLKNHRSQLVQWGLRSIHAVNFRPKTRPMTQSLCRSRGKVFSQRTYLKLMVSMAYLALIQVTQGTKTVLNGKGETLSRLAHYTSSIRKHGAGIFKSLTS